MQESEPDGIVRRLVPPVFAVIEDRYAIASVLVSKVGPLLGIYLLCCRDIVAPCYRADTEVVDSLRI